MLLGSEVTYSSYITFSSKIPRGAGCRGMEGRVASSNPRQDPCIHASPASPFPLPTPLSPIICGPGRLFRRIMAPLLRRRLQCFYCGRRSSQTYTPGLGEWRCGSCEATNHLDAVCLSRQHTQPALTPRQDGNITDPPAPAASSTVRYARAMERPPLPVYEVLDETLFCPTCLKNQHLLAQTLANYYPPREGPEDERFDEGYAAYRRGLEERYPQVCAGCEPRVGERIRATSYAAKTDHLRRLMERSRSRPLARRVWTWKHFVVYAGALAWWLGLAGQVLWNGFGALAVLGEGDSESREGMALLRCLLRGVTTGGVDPGCREAVFPFASMSLLLGILALWWNPCQSARLRGSPGRVRGLGEYYRLQAILIGSRILVWFVLGRDRDPKLDASMVRAIHATMLMTNLVVRLTTSGYPNAMLIDL
jgi:hypothetical protein